MKLERKETQDYEIIIHFFPFLPQCFPFSKSSWPHLREQMASLGLCLACASACHPPGEQCIPWERLRAAEVLPPTCTLKRQRAGLQRAKQKPNVCPVSYADFQEICMLCFKQTRGGHSEGCEHSKAERKSLDFFLNFSYKLKPMKLE